MPTKKNDDLIVDAVITWVNGNDKVWQDKLNKYAEVKIDFKVKEQSVRYNSVGEIDIAVFAANYGRTGCLSSTDAGEVLGR